MRRRSLIFSLLIAESCILGLSSRLYGQQVHFLGAHRFVIRTDSASPDAIRLSFIRSDSGTVNSTAYVYLSYYDVFTVYPCLDWGTNYISPMIPLSRDSVASVVVNLKTSYLPYMHDTVTELATVYGQDSRGNITSSDVDTFEGSFGRG